MRQNRFIAPSLILGLSAIIGIYVLAHTLKDIKNEEQTINTTGSASKIIISDLGILSGTLSMDASTPKEAFQNLQAQKPLLLAYFMGKGFPEDKIEFQTLNINPNYVYGANGQRIGIGSYTASQSMSIQSNDVNLIKGLSLDASSLVEQGVPFQVNAPEYYYTKLGTIKIEIQAAAARDAMARGQKIAEATGRKLGTLKSARMGVLQITSENSNTVSDYGINDVSSIRKEVRAVVGAEFTIK